jgi:Domain of unknown function (DUF4184)
VLTDNQKEIKYLKVLQHSSTLIGGIVIAYSIFKLPKFVTEKPEIEMKYWICVLLVAISIISLKIITGENSTKIGNLIVSLISSTMIGLIITPTILKKKNGS